MYIVQAQAVIAIFKTLKPADCSEHGFNYSYSFIGAFASPCARCAYD